VEELLHDRVSGAPILRSLPRGELDALLARAATRAYAPGAVLFAQGSVGSEVLLLLEGQVEVERAIDGHAGSVARRDAGEWIGESALFDEPRSATVSAVGAVRALAVARDALLGAIAAVPEATADLLRVVSQRLRESDAHRIETLRRQAEDLRRRFEVLARENRRLRGVLDERLGFDAFVGPSEAARRVREIARQAAASELTVLIHGETGTGKEVIARAIHAGGPRRKGPFVPLNCALVTESLLESQLFGHARGAFTGAAAAHRGLVEAADGGTLLLDEVGEISPALQGALLRFLELGEFRRLGETDLRHANVRVIAATHRDLERDAAEGRFRRDLLYRLDVVRIEIPPLRERPEDLPALVSHLIERFGARHGAAPLALDEGALRALAAYSWPGNVRELENEIERLHWARSGDAPVAADALSPRVASAPGPAGVAYTDAVRAYKLDLVRQALREAGGNRAKAARKLGVHRSNLVRMIRELGIKAD
jgi:transcriptional regulator with PAS, ATPase and Fis domain